MASVLLDRLWIHDARQLDTYLRFYSVMADDQRDRSGEVRTYASGRRRIIGRAGQAQTLGFTVRLVTPAQLEQLEDWRGVDLMVRDHVGRVVFGTYFALQVSDYKGRLGHDVSFQFVETTLVAGVAAQAG